ncbi:MAG: hypothetical protein QOE92_743 [Chloroflexota bacterium]|jgi:hypothetical protein|nr:hypothetical protein [Chloroflexota bacterium]
MMARGRDLLLRLYHPAYIALAVAIVVGAFGVRVQNLDAAPYGDEAYYYFTAHGLSHFFDTARYPVAGSAFPVMPLLYRPFTHSLESARAFNALVGTLAVLLVILILRDLRVSRPFQLAGGLLVALNPVEVQYSALLFEDMIGATIALAALWAYVRGRHGAAAALAAGAVLAKQYYAFFGIALFVDHLVVRRRLYYEMFLAGAVVVGWVVVRFGILGAPLSYLLEGHAIQPLGLRSLEEALGGWFLLPLVVAGAVLGPRLRPAAYMLVGFLGFLALWRNAQSWYFCLPIALSVLLAAYGAEMTWQRLRARPAAWAAAGVAAALMAVTVGVFSLNTRSFVRGWHDHDLNLAAARILAAPPPRLEMVGCFWAYQLYPFEDQGVAAAIPVTAWDNLKGDTALVCPEAPATPAGWRETYRAGTYAVATRGTAP